MNYITDYLKVLPTFDRNQVEKMIQEYRQSTAVSVISKEEFEYLLTELQKENENTMRAADGIQLEKMDEALYNDTHEDIQLDLLKLYKKHGDVEKVVGNYDRILKGNLEEVEREVNKLKKQIELLDMRIQSEDGLIVHGYGFEDASKSDNIESKNESTIHMYVDRDGTEIPEASFTKSYHQQFLTLKEKSTFNALEDVNGNIAATIEDISGNDWLAIKQNENHLRNAIDGSLTTYWSEVIMSEQPLGSTMEKG